jgi:hypothetical protein
MRYFDPETRTLYIAGEQYELSLLRRAQIETYDSSRAATEAIRRLYEARGCDEKEGRATDCLLD